MKTLLTFISIISILSAREHIAVIYFEGINVSEGEAKALTNRATSVLIDIGEYTILERYACW